MAAQAAKVLTISEFFQLPKDNLSVQKIQIVGKIVTEINGESFCLADKSTAIDCKMSQEHLLSPYLRKNAYIKIIKPGMA